MTHLPGTVIVPCQDLARYHRFTMCLKNLDLPFGSQVVFGFGTSIVDNLNSAIRHLREEDDWVWAIGDDHVFEADVVLKLLEREADVVAPLCVQRQPPFPLVHYDKRIELTEFYNTIQFDQLPADGELFEVAASGSAMLIRRRVLDAIGDPWYSNTHGRMNEDMDFCGKVRAAGFKVLVDPTLWIGHIGHVISYPQKRDGIWGLVLDFPGIGRNQIFMPGGIKAGHLGDLEAKGALVAV